MDSSGNCALVNPQSFSSLNSSAEGQVSSEEDIGSPLNTEPDIQEIVNDNLDEVSVVGDSSQLPIGLGSGLIFSSTLFEFNSSVIKEKFEVILNRLGDHLKSKNITQIQVHGHTDSVGPVDYNQGLSEERANAVLSFLVNNKYILANDGKATGFGEAKPIATNITELGRAKNRRVELYY